MKYNYIKYNYMKYKLVNYFKLSIMSFQRYI